MAPILYLFPLSPPVMAVQITAKALGMQLEEKVVDIQKDDHRKPEYIKLNPQHTVPTLVDEDGFIIWDSHAIMAYLVSKYGKSDSLYPKDLKKRAVIDQRLHFDTGVVFVTGVKLIVSVVHRGKTSLDDSDKESMSQVYEFLEAFLEDGKAWVAGGFLSIADYSMYTTISAANVLVPIDAQKYPKVSAWLKKVGSLPEAEVSKKGLAAFEALIKSKLK